MSVYKFLYLLGNCEPVSFKENFLVYKGGTETPPTAAEKKETKAEKPKVDLTEPDKKNEILNNLDQEKFAVLMEEKEIDGTKVELNALDAQLVEKLVLFCNDSGKTENFAKLIEKIKTDKINAAQLSQTSLEILLEFSYKNENEAIVGAENEIITGIFKSESATAAMNLLKASKENSELSKAIGMETLNHEALCKNLDTESLGILIKAVGFENVAKRISTTQKIALLGTTEIITSENKKTFYAEISKDPSSKEPETAKRLASSLAKADENKELYQNFLDSSRFYIKKAIAEDNKLETKIRKDAYEALKERKDEAIDPSAPAAAPKKPEEMSVLDNAGIEVTGTRVQFDINGVERSFIKTPTFVKKLEAMKNPDEAKLVAYERLLNIITRDHSIDKTHADYNKHQIATAEAFEASNTALKAEIERLKGVVPKAEKAPATAAETAAGEAAKEGSPTPTPTPAPTTEAKAPETAKATPAPAEKAAAPAEKAAAPAEKAAAPAEKAAAATAAAKTSADALLPKAEKTAEQIAKEKAYDEASLLPKLKQIYPDKEAAVKDQYVELEMVKGDFPKFYLEPQLDEKGELTNLILTYKRPFVGDTQTKSPDNLTDAGIKQFLEYEKEEVIEDLHDRDTFINLEESDIKSTEVTEETAALLTQHPFEIPDINKTFSITDEGILDLMGDDQEWNKNFDDLEGHGVYYSAFNDQFGISNAEVPARMRKIIGINRKVDFNDILREVANDRAPGYDVDQVDKFNDRFKNLLVESRKENPSAETLLELRKMYDIYLGGMKILKTLEKDKFKPAKKETFDQKYASQFELAETTNEPCAFDKYYSLPDMALERVAVANVDLQIGVSQKAYEQFLGVSSEYLKVSPKSLKASFEGGSFETGQILRAILRGYTFDELVSVRKAIKVSSREGAKIKFLLTEIPANFKADSPAVKMLLDRFKDDSLGDEKPSGELDQPTKAQSHKLRLAEIRGELSVSEEAYRQKVLELLRTHRVDRTKEADPTEWAASQAVDLSTDMTLRNIAYYYDVEGLEIRRFSSPEAIVDNLFGKQNVEIRNEKGEKETLKLYDFENGIKVINKEAVKKYIDLLIYQGLKRKRMKEVHRERIYRYEDMRDHEFEIAENKDLAQFMQSGGTPEAWNKLPGHEPIEETLGNPPFSVKSEDVPAYMHNFLKGKETVTLGNIVTELLKEKLEYQNPISEDAKEGVNSFESLKSEYEFVAERKKQLRDNPNRAKEKADIDRRFYALKVYVDAAAILIQRLEKAGTHVSIDETYTEMTSTNLLDRKPGKEANAQIDLLNEGYIAERERGKEAQMLAARGLDLNEIPELSGSYLIREIQLKALKEGYPASKIDKIESKLLIAAGAEIKGNKLSGGAVGFVVPIEEGFAIEFGASNKGGAIGLSAELYKTEQRSGGIAMGTGIQIMPTMFIGYSHSEKIGESTFFTVAIGTLFSATSANGMVGIALSHSDEAAVRTAETNISERTGFDKIEAAATPEEKVALLRKHEYFKDFEKDLADEDILALYDTYKSLNTEKALNEADKGLLGPITAIGIGVGFPPPTGFIGLKLKIGETIIIKPKIGERERIAQLVSQDKMQKRILDELNQRVSETNPSIEFKTTESGDLYMTKDGNIGTLESSLEKPMEIPNGTNLEDMTDQLKKANMTAFRREVAIKPGENPKSVIELSVYDNSGKDIAIYIDDRSPELEAAFTNNKILIPGNLDNVIITRETFRFPYAKAEGGATATDVIIITTNPKFDRNNIIRESNSVIEKHWQNGESKAWDMEMGANPSGKSQIHRLEEYKGEAAKEWTAEDFEVKGISRAEWKEIRDTSYQMKKGPFEGITQKELDEMPVRANWKEETEAVYKKMEKGMKEGSPAIDDAPGIIAKANEILTASKKPKIANAREAGQLLTLVQHGYFIDIWRKKSRDGIQKAFEKNNESIIKNVLIPQFTKQITALGIKPAAEAADYAKALAEKMKSYAETNFLKALDAIDAKLKGIKNPTDDQIKDAFSGLTTEIPHEMFFASGSTIRETHAGVLPGGPRAVEMPGIEKMGIIGAPKELDLNSGDQAEKDLARVLFETISPKPDLKNVETFHRSLAIKLATFEGTGIEIGKENYARLLEFYKLSEEKQAEALKTSTEGDYLHEFVKFAEGVREAMLKGENFKLKTGQELNFTKPQILTGAYGQCGNLSAMTHEGFFLIDKVRQIIVAHTLTDVYTDTDITKEAIELGLGVAITPAAAAKPEKRPPKRPPGKPHRRTNPRKPHSRGGSKEESPGEIPSGPAAGETPRTPEPPKPTGGA
ncbi:MAG: hypothetical protein ABIH78_02475 [Candidatus Peregrinibacteria bacterium]